MRWFNNKRGMNMMWVGIVLALLFMLIMGLLMSGVFRTVVSNLFGGG
jgi:hypothetical protein